MDCNLIEKNKLEKVTFNMHKYNELLDNFVMQSRNILENNLVGIYLHGSAVMG